MKNPFWQSEWQNINFNSLGVPLSFFKRPSSDFYAAFYSELFCRYEGFDALPLSWRENKANTARVISEIISDSASVLSVGCGLGFVEKNIIDKNPNLKMDAFDFADTAKRWLLDIERITCLTAINTTKKYKFIYCSQLLYALSDKELSDFAKFVVQHLDDGGQFLTVDTSLNPSENSEETISNKQVFVSRLKEFLRPVYYVIFRRSSSQFWGWQRDNIVIIKSFERNGLLLNKKISAVGQSFLIFQLKTPSH